MWGLFHVFLFRRHPRLFCTPTFQRVLPWFSFLRDVIILAVIISLAFYAFINSFLFLQVWDSWLPYGINCTFWKFQLDRAENWHKETLTHSRLLMIAKEMACFEAQTWDQCVLLKGSTEAQLATKKVTIYIKKN